jgi:DNA-binding transcriptional MocR family regulator
MDRYRSLQISPRASLPSAFSFVLDRDCSEGLVRQIAAGVRAEIEDGRLRPGTKLPSVREMSRMLGVSTFTAVAAYDLLASLHYVCSRRGAGYFVLRRANEATPRSGGNPTSNGRAKAAEPSLDIDAFDQSAISPGSGWLSPEWYSQNDLLSGAIRRVARSKPEQLTGSGDPTGYLRLRQHLARGLTERLFNVPAEQIVLTNGAAHAIELIIRTLLRAGDTVLVESPGYFYVNKALTRHGCKLVAAPRSPDGIDLEAVARLAHEHRPKVMFVTTVLQNPLGTTLQQVEVYRLLSLAEGFDFLIVEDDTFRDLGSDADPCLAALDGLNRVLSLKGFSKTISPSLRSGYVACNARVADEITRTKMATGMTTSEIGERILLEMISAPGYRRSLDRLRIGLESAAEVLRTALEAAGLTLLAQPKGGMFMSAGWRVPSDQGCTAQLIAEESVKHGLVLAPGDAFCLSNPDSIWFRFNVTYNDTPRLQEFLARMPQVFGWSSSP